MSGTEITAEPGTPQIVMTRAFSATPEQVYRAHTDPDLIARWLGPERLKLRVETHEVRDGGRWRFVHIDEDGTEYGFHGVFHGTPSPQAGLVRTFEFEGRPATSPWRRSPSTMPAPAPRSCARSASSSPSRPATP